MLTIILGQSRGFLEMSHAELTLILSGDNQTVEANFTLDDVLITQVYSFNSGIYALSSTSLYRSTDSLFIEEYGTEGNTDPFRKIFHAPYDSEEYLIGHSGVYKYNEGT